jgi:hypothetical protein
VPLLLPFQTRDVEKLQRDSEKCCAKFANANIQKTDPACYASVPNRRVVLRMLLGWLIFVTVRREALRSTMHLRRSERSAWIATSPRAADKELQIVGLERRTSQFGVSGW